MCCGIPAGNNQLKCWKEERSKAVWGAVSTTFIDTLLHMTIKHLQEADFVVNFPGAVGFGPDEQLSGLWAGFCWTISTPIMLMLMKPQLVINTARKTQVEDHLPSGVDYEKGFLFFVLFWFIWTVSFVCTLNGTSRSGQLTDAND